MQFIPASAYLLVRLGSVRLIKRKMFKNSQVESFVEKRKEGPPLCLRPELRVVREVGGRNDFEADVGITEAVVGARMKLKIRSSD